jgi:hypothetical protein
VALNALFKCIDNSFAAWDATFIFEASIPGIELLVAIFESDAYKSVIAFLAYEVLALKFKSIFNCLAI